MTAAHLFTGRTRNDGKVLAGCSCGFEFVAESPRHGDAGAAEHHAEVLRGLAELDDPHGLLVARGWWGIRAHHWAGCVCYWRADAGRHPRDLAVVRQAAEDHARGFAS